VASVYPIIPFGPLIYFPTIHPQFMRTFFLALTVPEVVELTPLSRGFARTIRFGSLPSPTREFPFGASADGKCDGAFPQSSLTFFSLEGAPFFHVHRPPLIAPRWIRFSPLEWEEICSALLIVCLIRLDVCFFSAFLRLSSFNATKESPDRWLNSPAWQPLSSYEPPPPLN